MQTITPSTRAALLASVVETRAGELAIVTRFNGDQIFGLLCTGPLTNSANCLGELNEFLLNITAGELARFTPKPL